jgi:hypothetical protein
VPEATPTPAEEARHLHACLFRAPLDAAVAERYQAALSAAGAGNSILLSRLVARRLDAEAVEFALRRRGTGADLTRRMRILCYLVEVRADYLAQFVNLESSRRRAWAALVSATVRSGWKLLKGEYLIRRHGLV